MAKQTINNGDSGLVARTKINENFTEVYAVTSSYVEVDFGSTKEFNKTVTVANALITATSIVVCSLAAVATSDHSIDEVLIEEITVIGGNVINATSFDIMAYCPTGTTGKYNVNYTIKY